MFNLPEFFTKHRRRIAIAAAAILLAIIAVNVFVYWYFPRYVDPRTPADTIDTLQTSIQITSIVVSLIGSALLIGTVITALGSISQTQQSLELNREQLRVAQESQITERFTKAIEQLGSDNLAIRLGGIYALERIAKDSPRDHWTVMEVLTAFVRENSPVSNNDYKPTPKPQKPATDIQAILTVIGRRDASREAEIPQRIDLSRTYLRGADFRYANLSRMNFFQADLTSADLFDANLTEASFFNATLIETNLTSANLTEAHLGLAMLTKAVLSRATLIDAELPGANLTRADLSHATLTGAHLAGANLTRANLSDANLTGASFPTATFTGARLSGATFAGTTLYQCNFSGVDLEFVNGITEEQFAKALIDENTKLPIFVVPEVEE